MKEYPSIQPQIVHKPVYAFDKLDGSNVRAEWSRKRGFYKFGKRHGLVGKDDPLLGEAEGLIVNTQGETLSKIFHDARLQNAVAFFEFHGPGSFAGNHADEPHKVTLLDVTCDKKGFMHPREFIKTFAGKVETAEFLYQGNPNDPFLDLVRSGRLLGMTFEGVICKGDFVSPGLPLMFKVKNQAWIDKVRGQFADNPELIKKLL